MNNHFGYCERCYKKIINIEDIYVRQTDDGDFYIVLNVKNKYYIQKQNLKDLLKFIILI